MGGTFTPTPNQAFVDMAIDDFINPTVDPNLLPVQGSTVTYPASGGIISGPGAPTINESVAIGVANLEQAIAEQPADQPIIVFGYSQSTVVSMILKAKLEERKARGEAVPDVTFVGIGVGNRPHGGITTRLNGITIPVFDFTFNGPAPTDPEFGFTTIDIAREYDGLADFPLYVADLPAVLNALLGIVFVHGRYDEVSLDPNSPKYVPGTIEQQYGDTTYYLIPTPDLPLFDPARAIGVPESLIDVVEPVVKVAVDAGYDRTIPFGEPTSLRVVPQVDRAEFTADLVAAVGTGVANALKLVAPPAATTDQKVDGPTDDTSGATTDSSRSQPAEATATPKPLTKHSRVRHASLRPGHKAARTASEPQRSVPRTAAGPDKPDQKSDSAGSAKDATGSDDSPAPEKKQ